METISSRIDTMQDLLYCSHKLCFWQLGGNMEFISGNCPKWEFFYKFFLLSTCSVKIKEHFNESDLPTIVSDQLGITWIADMLQGEYYLLGPIFSIEAAETHIRQTCMKMKFAGAFVSEFLTYVNDIPVIHFRSALSYAVMLHRCITREAIGVGDIALEMFDSGETSSDDWAGVSWHGTWAAEQELFRRIKNGDLGSYAEMAAKFSTGNVGILSHGDPLRQMKNEGIVFATLASRAAILGGVSPEGGYNLADYYILRIENARMSTDVQSCISEMIDAFLQRVKQAKKVSGYSLVVRNCAEYIETHICEKISLEAMAKELAYNGYYLSAKFQKEVGVSINQYINQRKIERAIQILKSGEMSASTISDQLGFSSPSYFSSVFRQCTGLSPTAYIKEHGIE